MHSRRRIMHERADAFVALPGGIGTLEELVETVSWATLGLHGRPVVLLDTAYWSPFLALLDHMEAQGFAHRSLRTTVEAVDDPAEAVARLLRHRAS